MSEQFGYKGLNKYTEQNSNIEYQETTEEDKLWLQDLDVKGREITGLEPKPERFSRLSGDDYKIVLLNKDIIADTNLEDNYVFVNPQNGDEERLVEPPHWRTISQEIKAEYRPVDNPVEYYYVANTKGVGYLKPTLKGGHTLDEYDVWNRVDEYGNKYDAYGLVQWLDFGYDAEGIVERTKKLTMAGLRTELYHSVANLQKVYYKGQLVSVDELREKGVIPKNKKKFRPQIGIRLLKMNNRIAEVKDSDKERVQYLFNKAFIVFNQETVDKKLDYPVIKLGDSNTEKIYFQAFFERMGRNLAVCQNLGIIGWDMHSANVTLAAELVDTAAYLNWREKDFYIVKKYNGVRFGSLKDYRDIAYGLRYLIRAGEKVGMALPDKETLFIKFMEKFNASLDEKLLKKEKVDKKDVVNAVGRVVEAVIIKEAKLGAIKGGSNITDWNIGF